VPARSLNVSAPLYLNGVLIGFATLLRGVIASRYITREGAVYCISAVVHPWASVGNLIL
jgi:hypothetical protein